MNKNKNKYMLYIILYALTYFFASTLIYYISIFAGYSGLGLPVFGGGDDGEFYYQEAINVANDLPAILTSIHPKVQGLILKMFHTEEVFILKIFNLLGSLLTLLVCLRIISIIHKKERSFIVYKILIVMLAFYPSFLLNSNLSIIRDSWIVFYYMFSIYLTLNILKINNLYFKMINLVLLCFSLWMLMGYRKYALLSYLAALILYLLFISKKPSKKRIKILFLFTFAGFSIVYSFLKSYRFPVVNLSLEDVFAYRENGLEIYAGGSQMYISLDQSNVGLFYLNYIYSVISNSLGPFPWQFTGISTVLLFFTESILFLFIVYKIFKLRKKLSKFAYFLIINSIIWFMLIGIFNDNIGTAARLRMVGWVPLFIVFAKVYGEQLVQRKSLKMKETIE